MLLEVATAAIDYSDHNIITLFLTGLGGLAVVFISFFFGGLYTEHKELVTEHRTYADTRKNHREQHQTLWENHIQNKIIEANNKKEFDDFKEEVFEKFDYLEKMFTKEITKERASNIAINNAAMEILFKIEKKIDHK